MMNGLYFLNLVSKTDQTVCPTRCAGMADPVWTWSGPSIAANCQGGPRRARPTPPPTIMAIASALPRLLTATALPRPQ